MKNRKVRPKFLSCKDAKSVNILLCRPDHYGIEYSINPWMDTNNRADREIALQQWSSLNSAILQTGAKVQYIDPQPGVPDMVFVANAGLVLDQPVDSGGFGLIILSSFLHPERQLEEPIFYEYFVANRYQTRCLSVPFEGAGDALKLNGVLIGGYGFRTEKSAYEEMVAKGYVQQAASVRLVDPRFYHLDTCFCPLQHGDYLIYPNAISGPDFATIATIGTRAIVVPECEAVKFACNAVCIGDDVILPSDCPETMKLLEAAGYVPHPVEMSQFIRSGGACKCLTLAL